MNDKVLFENNQIVIKDSSNNILFCKLSGFVNLSVIKVFDAEMVTAIRKTKAKKIITDTSDMKVIAKDAQKYNEENLVSNWHRLRIKYNAIILSSSIFGKLSIEAIKDNSDNSKTQSGFLIKMFDSFEDAFEWIDNEN